MTISPHPDDVTYFCQKYNVTRQIAKRSLRFGCHSLIRVGNDDRHIEIISYLDDTNIPALTYRWYPGGIYVFQDPEVATMVKIMFG